MKNQMKGIALILFGILISVSMGVIGLDIFASIGVLVGIVGLAFVFWQTEK